MTFLDRLDAAGSPPELEILLSPVAPAQFRREILGRTPLHIPAGDDDCRRAVLTWEAFNGLLNQTSVWTGQTLRLMRDAIAVPQEEYCNLKPSAAGPVLRPWPEKVEVFLTAGASLLANSIQGLHPPIGRVAAILSRAFAAEVGANVYCSFKGVQAFGPHYDMHDVFALQTEGEKLWRIYENQVEVPIDLPAETSDTRRQLEAARGRLLTEILMRPGDILYLPRGRYHDAVAVDGPSLHVTFSVTALHGRTLMSLLDSAALQDPAFRAYLPPAGLDGGDALRSHLKALAPRLAALVASPEFFDEVAMTQERLVPRPGRFDLPARKPMTLFQVTGLAFPDTGIAQSVAFDWCAAERRFSLEDMIAQFDFIEERTIRDAVALAERSGAIVRLAKQQDDTASRDGEGTPVRVNQGAE